MVGEAGVGKSRLLAEVAAAAERDGDRVLVGRAWEPEQVLPFAPWVDAFRGGRVPDDLPILEGLLPRWRGELTRLIPEVSSASAAGRLHGPPGPYSKPSEPSSRASPSGSRSSSSWRTSTGPTT